MPNISDGIYSRKPWQAPPEAAYPPQAYIGPFASNQERLVSQSMAVNMMTAEEIQKYVRPPLPQVNLFPSRFGYTSDEIGVADIIDLPRRAQQRNESDFSQTPNTTESTSTNSLGGTI